MQSFDVSLFRFINASLSNSVFDRLMPFLSDSPLFGCLFLLVGIMLVWRGGARGRVCALMLLLSLCLGNWMVCDPLKHVLGRLRPFQALPDVVMRGGKGGSFSMPSSHAANWFALAMVFLIYYRRTVWIMLPVAILVGFSRVYNGMHYPSDVLAGAVLGAGYSAAIIGMLDTFWQWLGPRWFPIWKAQLPSLLNPVVVPAREAGDQKIIDAQWLRLGCVLTGFLMLLRLAYLASGKIELSEDEAYQWIWSKHLALSYYSKPPLIAYTQFLGTHIWGDTQFGVRFFSPIIAALLSLLVLRFMARQTSGRTAFILLLVMSAAPLLDLGAIVMTVDPLSVLFWTAAMITGWRAAGAGGMTRQWMWTGLWMGLGFLSKPTNLFQFVCWAVFFMVWPPTRAHLRRPGPWLALLIVAICSLPVVIWNGERHWIMAAHVASDGKLGEKWERFFVLEFLWTESLVLNPIFFIGALWAAAAFWFKSRRDPWQLFLFSMGMPLFLMYLAVSFHSRIEPNWIAPAVVPLFCLMAFYWRSHWSNCSVLLRPLLGIGIGLGVFAAVLAHDPQLIDKLIHHRLPARLDVLRRVRGWAETARIVGQARQVAEAQGKPAFIICEHYGFTSEISFYLPEAKQHVKTDPLVYYYVTPKPDNQFYFWPNYLDRTNQNAIFVREIDKPRFRVNLFSREGLSRWWHHSPDLYINEIPPTQPVPAVIRQEFESITDLGVRDVVADGNIVRRLQLFECHNLR